MLHILPTANPIGLKKRNNPYGNLYYRVLVRSVSKNETYWYGVSENSTSAHENIKSLIQIINNKLRIGKIKNMNA